MNKIYQLPGYVLVCFGGFCLSWGGYIIRLFESASVWQILFLRSFFFVLGLIFFLIIIYKKNTFNIIKTSGYPALFGGFVLSFSFISFETMINTRQKDTLSTGLSRHTSLSIPRYATTWCHT